MAYTPTPADNETIANLPGDIRAVNTKVDNHTGATAAAHAASAINYGSGTVQAALDTAAGHENNTNNPHNTTAAQVGAVALTDVDTSATANKVVKRNADGTITGNITGSAEAVAWTKVVGIPATFTPPTATASVLGGVKIGTGVNVTSDGTISVPASLDWTKTANFTASTVGAITPSGAGISGSGAVVLLNVPASSGVAAGTFSLQGVIQQLINKSHTHGATQFAINCVCNCIGCGA